MSYRDGPNFSTTECFGLIVSRIFGSVCFDAGQISAEVQPNLWYYSALIFSKMCIENFCSNNRIMLLICCYIDVL